MSQQIFFIRHGKVNLPYRSHAEMPFEILCELASGQLNPPIDSTFTQNLVDKFVTQLPKDKPIFILASPSQRCQETAQLLATTIEKNIDQKISVKTCDALREVGFNLKKLFPEARLEEVVDISDINRRVLSGMLSGGDETLEQVMVRVKKVFLQIAELGSGTIICVAHDFFLRAVQLTIQQSAPEALLSTKTNGYLEGFLTDDEHQKFIVIPSVG